MAKPNGSLGKRSGRYYLKEKPAETPTVPKLTVVPPADEDEHSEPAHRASA